jgi:hypothetical protein
VTKLCGSARIEPKPALLLRGFALTVGRSSEVNGRQEHADQQHEEVNLHCISTSGLRRCIPKRWSA